MRCVSFCCSCASFSFKALNLLSLGYSAYSWSFLFFSSPAVICGVSAFSEFSLDSSSCLQRRTKNFKAKLRLTFSFPFLHFVHGYTSFHVLTTSVSAIVGAFVVSFQIEGYKKERKKKRSKRKKK